MYCNSEHSTSQGTYRPNPLIKIHSQKNDARYCPYARQCLSRTISLMIPVLEHLAFHLGREPRSEGGRLLGLASDLGVGQGHILAHGVGGGEVRRVRYLRHQTGTRQDTVLELHHLCSSNITIQSQSESFSFLFPLKELVRIFEIFACQAED